MKVTNNSKKKFRLLDPMRDGKGVEKGEDTTPNLKRFFKLFGRKFWRLVSLNLMMIVQIIPLAVCIFLALGGPKVPTQYSALYAPLLGAQTALPTAEGITLFTSAAGLMHQTPIFNSWVHWVMGLMVILHLATFGWQTVGATYILRNLVRGDGVFLISDYFYAIRRNWKQGLIMGIIDTAIIGTLVFDFMYFWGQPSSGLNNFMYVMILALALIYLIMRFYTYLMLVTFDMKITKIFKNALIFVVLGIKRNLMALLGMALLIALAVVMIAYLGAILPAVIILPFLYLMSFCGFMATFAAYPVIQKYMIDPVVNPKAAETAEAAEAAEATSSVDE